MKTVCKVICIKYFYCKYNNNTPTIDNGMSESVWVCGCRATPKRSAIIFSVKHTTYSTVWKLANMELVKKVTNMGLVKKQLVRH